MFNYRNAPLSALFGPYAWKGTSDDERCYMRLEISRRADAAVRALIEAESEADAERAYRRFLFGGI